MRAVAAERAARGAALKRYRKFSQALAGWLAVLFRLEPRYGIEPQTFSLPCMVFVAVWYLCS